MMRTLIVPDVHENLPKLWNIEDTLFPEADRVVMLGDFFDTFFDHHVKDAALWIKRHIDDVDICWGNHDCQYAFKHRAFRCAGYEQDSKIIIDSVLDTEHWRKFKIFTHVGKFIVSHAGFHPRLIGLMEPIMVDTALQMAFDDGFHAMWSPGRAVGGYAPVGGPTWIRWDGEFQAGEQAQIVGHTMRKGVRAKSYAGVTSYCLDTALRHVMWVDETSGEVEIVRV